MPETGGLKGYDPLPMDTNFGAVGHSNTDRNGLVANNSTREQLTIAESDLRRSKAGTATTHPPSWLPSGITASEESRW